MTLFFEKMYRYRNFDYRSHAIPNRVHDQWRWRSPWKVCSVCECTGNKMCFWKIIHL